RSPVTSIVAPIPTSLKPRLTWFYGSGHNMGRTVVVISLLSGCGHAEDHESAAPIGPAEAGQALRHPVLRLGRTAAGRRRQRHGVEVEFRCPGWGAPARGRASVSGEARGYLDLVASADPRL